MKIKATLVGCGATIALMLAPHGDDLNLRAHVEKVKVTGGHCQEDQRCWRAWMGNGTTGPGVPRWMLQGSREVSCDSFRPRPAHGWLRCWVRR